MFYLNECKIEGPTIREVDEGRGGGLNLKSGLSENYTYFVENIKDKVTALYILYTSQFQPCFVLAAILK